MFDDFDTQVQVEEMIAEYEAWLEFCASMEEEPFDN